MRIFPVRNGLDTAATEACADALRDAGIICYPTETFYALGIDPWSHLAREKLFALKGRDADKELPMIAADVEMVKRCCRTDHRVFDVLSRRFWPGPLTLVLPDRNSSATIAIRVSAHPVAREISRTFQSPIVSTSANRSGEPPVQDPRDFPQEFADSVEIMVDTGICQGGFPSTILSLARNNPELLREGAIPFREIESTYEALKESH